MRETLFFHSCPYNSPYTTLTQPLHCPYNPYKSPKAARHKNGGSCPSLDLTPWLLPFIVISKPSFQMGGLTL